LRLELRQGFVVSVNVFKKENLPVFFRNRSGVHDQNGNCAVRRWKTRLAGFCSVAVASYHYLVSITMTGPHAVSRMLPTAYGTV
jgi:hypothetical protein